MARWLWPMVWLLCGPAGAAEVLVAVAANFAAPMGEIAAAFAADAGHQARLSFGGTGKFYAQIRQGAPFQVLLAADTTTPARLEQEGAGIPGSRFTYATGRLVLWSAQPGLVDDQGKVLQSDQFRHLAIANPRLAPYGAAAREVLTGLGLLDRLQARLVEGENIAQTHQFVASGNAELGFVARSQVMQDGRLSAGSAWLVPADLHRPIRQEALVLNPGRDQPAVAALVGYLRGDRARAIIQRYGYE